MGRRVDLLITHIRNQTDNTDFSDTTGIADSEFIQYLNDAQNRLQSVVVAQHPSMFIKEVEISAVAAQELYSLPSDAYLGNKIVMLEYSPNGRSDEYYPLELTTLKQRSTNLRGAPLFYTRKSGKFLVNPMPSTSAGKFRLNYVKRVDQFDLRRSVVESVTLDSVNREIDALTLDVDSALVTFATSTLADCEYICIVSKTGTVKMRNIPIDSINTTTGVVTVSSGFVYSSGETIVAGDYVVAGADASTHSEFPQNCERYFIAYCAWKILKRDSSVDNAEQTQELLAMENDIVAAFSEVEEDIHHIPILSDWE